MRPYAFVTYAPIPKRPLSYFMTDTRDAHQDRRKLRACGLPVRVQKLKYWRSILRASTRPVGGL